MPLPSDSNTQILRHLGSSIRAARRRRALTRAQLAELIDVHPRIIEKIEAGELNPKSTTLLRFRMILEYLSDRKPGWGAVKGADDGRLRDNLSREQRSTIGRRGGRSVSQNREHMAALGRKGGQAVHLKNPGWMAEIGRRGGKARRKR